MKSSTIGIVTSVLIAVGASAVFGHGSDAQRDKARSAADKAILPLMKKLGIPGMAVGIAVGGKSYVFDYGVASTESQKPVSPRTLFEVGSISKTFTATLASWAQVSGQLSLSDKTSQYFPSLRGTKFGEVSLLHLGTHTPGGLPLQVPDDIKDNAQLLKYFEQWQPTYAPGTYRTYANPSIGFLGVITAQAMKQDFVGLMEERLFRGLGLANTFLNVPEGKMSDYAQGYTKDDAPIRMTAGVLGAEAYGVKTTAADLIRFVEANMGAIALDEKLQRAVTATHTTYFQAGVMTQDLIWEQYPWPVELKTLLEGNSPGMIFKAVPVTAITPPQEPRNDVLINKTGSTSGFGAYVVFVPKKRIGIVILANKNYPIEDRVKAAYEILLELEPKD